MPTLLLPEIARNSLWRPVWTTGMTAAVDRLRGAKEWGASAQAMAGTDGRSKRWRREAPARRPPHQLTASVRVALPSAAAHKASPSVEWQFSLHSGHPSSKPRVPAPDRLPAIQVSRYLPLANVESGRSRRNVQRAVCTGHRQLALIVPLPPNRSSRFPGAGNLGVSKTEERVDNGALAGVNGIDPYY